MMMPNPSWKANIDQLSSDWIDGCDGEAAPADAACLLSLEETTGQHYLADLLLVDALLTNMADGADRERQQRIGRVMDAIVRPAHTRRLRVQSLRRSSIVALAACLLMAVTLAWLQFARDSRADDVLLAVNEVSAEATDRVYAIQRARGTSSGLGAYQARLYLRGRSGLVITCGQVVLGRNADQFWLVDSLGRVTLSDDFHWIDARSTQDELGLRFLQELSLESRHIPLMQLSSVAELMQHDYDVTLIQGQHNQRDADLLIGNRRSARSELPAAIQLWADSRTRIIQRAELRWEHDNAVVLDLLPAEPVPPEWYSYEAHCPENPSVHHLPPKL